MSEFNSETVEDRKINPKRKILTWADVLSSLICLGSMLPGLAIFSRLPEQIVTNFDLSGEPSGYMSKAFAVFGIPAVVAVMQLIMCAATNFFFGGKVDRVNAIIRFINPVIMYFVTIMILMYSMGLLSDVMAIMGSLVGLVFIITGNYLPKLRRNFFLGIRTPRTLTDEENWDLTQRFAGGLYIFGGILIFAITLMKIYIALIAVTVLLLIIPYIYSEIVYYAKRRRGVKTGNTQG